MLKEMIGYAQKARKSGIVSLDDDLEEIKEPFLKKTLMLAVDGTEPAELRSIMELELDNRADHDDNIPMVFESAGGFSPTLGIIGAVLGPDSGDAASRQYRRSGPRDCGGFCRHHLRRGRRESLLSSRRRQTEAALSRGAAASTR